MTSQPYPFSKSRYFPHKRLRSADFIRDQGFVEGKLNFLSRWTFGEGAAVGLGVQRIDADSLLVSPGFAIDACGRYLIVDEPTICRIRTLQGFESLHRDTATLWLAYQEEMTDEMFVPGDREDVQEYAAVRERFGFYLTDGKPPAAAAVDQTLFSDVALFEDDDLRIRQVIPRALPAKGLVQLRLVIERFSPDALEVELHYAPQLPGSVSAETGQLPGLDLRLSLREWETVLPLTISFATTAQAVLLTLPEGGFLLDKRGVQLRAQCVFQEEFPVIAGDPMQALEGSLLAHSTQELWGGGGEPGVPIAGLHLIRYGDKSLLDCILPAPQGRQAALPYLRERLRRCSGFFPAPPETRPEIKEKAPPPPDSPPPQAPVQMTTGAAVLNAGLHLKEGKILCSEEISHGLGPGTVFVTFGVENVYPAAETERNYTDLLLGDVTLFAQASGTYDHDFDRGVRVHPERGTFELAVRLKGELRQSSLRLRWFAWRPEEKQVRKIPSSALLRLEPDVIRTTPGAKINFVPVFSNGNAAPCDFTIPDKQAGFITPNGIYTAPKKEGLYQVCAQIKNMPETKVNAFVMVRAAAEGAGNGPESL